MPVVGGEPDKLGNRFEAIWTVYQLLGLLQNDVTQLTCEKFDEAVGIEFVKITSSGIRELHSLKYKTPKSNWTIPLLTAKGENDRSILDDLLGKLKNDGLCEAHFVSQVSANDLWEISEEARKCQDIQLFRDRLNKERRDYFSDYLVKRCADETAAFNLLKRLRVETLTQTRLIEMVEERIRYVLYDEKGDLNPLNVRLYLAEFLLESLGEPITRVKLVEKLNRGSYYEANWAQSQKILGKIQERNESYLRSVKVSLINGQLIPRQESQAAFDHILKDDTKYGMFVGTAGRGKSCAIAGLLDSLQANAIPYLALRLDTPFDAKTPTTWGLELGFPMSPVNLLAAIAEGRRCVLLLDQLDALSLLSGRKTITWDLLTDILSQTKLYPNMRIWLACRDFDLEHDYRLQALVKRENAHPIHVDLLSETVVKDQINIISGLSAANLTPRQIEMLRTPMHLSLYLEGDPANKQPFETVQDLYDRYWDRKKSLVEQMLGREPKWNQVIDHLCDELSANQTLTAPRRPLEENFDKDVAAMASENVIALDLGRYRFFHEGFFDYAFARRFALRNRKLVDLLLHDGEQHLFRRAQVRQILTYLRDQDDGRQRYHAELTRLLTTDGIRPHIIKLVLDWQSSLPDPTLEEAAILKLV